MNTGQYHYEHDGEWFIYFDGRGVEVQRCKRLAIGYSEDQEPDGEITMHKHGEPWKINQWVDKCNERMCHMPDMPVFKLVDVTDWSLDRINRCIQICGRLNIELRAIDIEAKEVP